MQENMTKTNSNIKNRDYIKIFILVYFLHLNLVFFIGFYSFHSLEEFMQLRFSHFQFFLSILININYISIILIIVYIYNKQKKRLM